MLVIKKRITRNKGTFKKGFTSNWTEEVFTISGVKTTKPPTYIIEDTLGGPVQGSFHEQELRLSVQEFFSYRASTQEEEKSSICQVERVQ